MESKADQAGSSAKQVSNVNIDINGEPEESTVKNNLNLDASDEGRVGLSKEELMKYANQPFWVRLRNILFATFWILWLSILAAAIGYVVHSPGCVKLASAANATTMAPSSPST